MNFRVGKPVLVLIALPWLLSAQTLEEGLTLYRKGSLSEAKKVFEVLLEKDGKNPEAHYRLGMIHLNPRLRDVDKAVEHMEEAVDLSPDNADYQYGLGAAYGTEAQSAGVFRQALLAPKIRKAFERATQLNPKHLEAHIGLAQYFHRAPGIMGGDTERAWKEAEIIIGLDEVRGRSFKAELFLSEKKTAEAEKEYKALLVNKPKEWRAWRGAGNFYLRTERADDAVAAMKKYVELKPDTADSFSRLAQACILKKDPDQAIALLNKAFGLDKEFAPAISLLAQAYEMKGQKKEARETYQRLLARDLSDNQRKNLEKKINELNN